MPEMSTIFKVNTTEVMHNFGSLNEIWVGVAPAYVITLIALLSLLVLVYWLFYVPCNWVKRLDDVSYDRALGNTERKANSIHRRDAINRLRRLRNVGAQELPPPFPNGWYGIMESSELRKGEATSISCLGENFVVYRTMENHVYVLDAYCPHMGANMGVGGRVYGDSIECPFHQWRFRGSDGICTNIPYSRCAPQGFKVKSWISQELNDNIFVWYHAEGDANPWPLTNVAVEEIESGAFVYHGRNEFYINCHIQEIPENGADLAHFTAIHNASVLAGSQSPVESILADAGCHRWQAIWKPTDGTDKHLAAVTLKHSIELLPKVHVFRMDVTGDQIGPSYVQLHLKSPTLGHVKVLQTITPIEPLLQKVVHRFYAPRIMGPVMKFLIFGESIMFERDMNMWNHKIFRSKPKLVKEDVAIKTFRNWYSQFYTENSKSFTEARDSLDW